MGILSRELGRGLKSLRTAMDNPVLTYGNSEVPCVPSDLEQNPLLVSGGIDTDGDIALLVLAEHIPAGVLLEKHALTYDGTRYRIKRRTSLPGGAGIKLTCSVV